MTWYASTDLVPLYVLSIRIKQLYSLTLTSGKAEMSQEWIEQIKIETIVPVTTFDNVICDISESYYGHSIELHYTVILN